MAEEQRRKRLSPKERKEQEAEQLARHLEAWKPKTRIGLMVKSGEITSYDQVLASGLPVLEPETEAWFLLTRFLRLPSLFRYIYAQLTFATQHTS